MHREMLDSLIKQKKFSVIIEYMRIKFPEKTILFSEYTSKDLRYFPTKKGLHVLCPKTMTPIQEGNLAHALMGGDIFDNEEEIENACKYTMMTTMPYTGMNKENISDQHVAAFTKGVIGKVSDDGSVANPEDIQNGITGLKDLFDNKDALTYHIPDKEGSLHRVGSTQNPDKIKEVVSHHFGVDDYWDLPREVRDELIGLNIDVDNIQSCPDDAMIDEDDAIDAFDSDGEAVESNYSDDEDPGTVQEGSYTRKCRYCGKANLDAGDRDIDCGCPGSIKAKQEQDKTDEANKKKVDQPKLKEDKNGQITFLQEFAIPDETFIQEHDPEYFLIQEGLFKRKPKQLKPIGRDLIAYIMTAINEVQDTNDQAMLSGYICSKLELVDFYITVLDTKDARYIVPHPRQYLVSMQQTLTSLLGQVLKIKPINRNDKAWRVNVNYPDGWGG